MQITLTVSHNYLKKGALVDKTAVVIDVLRAASTIVTAFENGCDRIIPANSANEAAEIRKVAEGEVLLGGEIGSMKISGFDLGNSPLEYSAENILDKIIVFSTSNGSPAIKRCDETAYVLVGCNLNAQAIADKVIEIGRDAIFVCAGTNGSFSTDDILSAGCILERILRVDRSVELDDLGKVALKMYRNGKSDLMAALEGSAQYEHLIDIGLKKDVEYCMQEDVISVVPLYKEGIIIK